MSRGAEYEFVPTDLEALKRELIGNYEDITGRTLQPGDPDRLFLSVILQMLLQERVNLNYIGNQNIPSRAEGENLDALGQWIFSLPRNPAQAAVCTVRFYITAAQESAVAIPRGTRVTDVSQAMVWETTEDALIAIGDTYTDVNVQAETAGEAGNGYAAGQINTLIDVDNVLYFDHCANTAESYGGAETETDDEYFARMQLSAERHTTAGSRGSYIYWAKSVSSQIADVVATRGNETEEETITNFYKDVEDPDTKIAILGGNVVAVTIPGAVEGEDYELQNWSDYYLLLIPQESSLYDEEEISVTVTRSTPGTVAIYALMETGEAAGSQIKAAILAACNADDVRPLTDHVIVADPVAKTFNADLTYYVPADSEKTLAEIQADVTAAVNEYIAWQTTRLGRAINPAKLQSLLHDAGINRYTVRAPVYQALKNGSDGAAPEYAQLGAVNIVNGGYDDE